MVGSILFFCSTARSALCPAASRSIRRDLPRIDGLGYGFDFHGCHFCFDRSRKIPNEQTEQIIEYFDECHRSLRMCYCSQLNARARLPSFIQEVIDTITGAILHLCPTLARVKCASDTIVFSRSKLAFTKDFLRILVRCVPVATSTNSVW